MSTRESAPVLAGPGQPSIELIEAWYSTLGQGRSLDRQRLWAGRHSALRTISPLAYEQAPAAVSLPDL